MQTKRKAETSRRSLVRRAASIALGALCALAIGCSSGGQSSTSTEGAEAAYVGDQVIYEDEVTSYTQDMRESLDLTDDAKWAQWLTDSGFTAETWREDVIRTKADRMLVEKRAAELGIVPDSQRVDERLAAAREAAGAQDDAAWEEYLKSQNQTPDELRDLYEFSSLEQQLVDQEVSLSSDVRDEMCDDYLKTNLADQVVRHYIAFQFPTKRKADAQQLLDELAALDKSQLADRFTIGENAEAIDLGWDFAYNETVIDPQLKLRKAKLKSRQLYDDVLEGSDVLRVVYCAERVELSGDIAFKGIKSDSLKQLVADLTRTTQWSALLQQYLTDLETQANVQVVPMPDGLPYDVME